MMIKTKINSKKEKSMKIINEKEKLERPISPNAPILKSEPIGRYFVVNYYIVTDIENKLKLIPDKDLKEINESKKTMNFLQNHTFLSSVHGLDIKKLMNLLDETSLYPSVKKRSMLFVMGAPPLTLHYNILAKLHGSISIQVKYERSQKDISQVEERNEQNRRIHAKEMREYQKKHRQYLIDLKKFEIQELEEQIREKQRIENEVPF